MKYHAKIHFDDAFETEAEEIAASGISSLAAKVSNRWRKYELVHKEGNRLFNSGNSNLTYLELAPLNLLTARCTPNCGSTSINKCTWSGIISISRISTLISSAICAINSLSLEVIAVTSTFCLYFGQEITWYLHE